VGIPVSIDVTVLHSGVYTTGSGNLTVQRCGIVC
jgi:hypothetical protein